MARLEFRILGPIEGRAADGAPIDLGARKQRAVLAMLLLEPGRVVSVDRIVAGLWNGEAPASATGTLQAYVSQLRRALEPDRPPRTPPAVLLTREPGYLLAIDGDQVDAVRFAAGVEAARTALARGDLEAAERDLNAALREWRGAALADVADEAFAAAAVAQLDELRDGALEDLSEVQLGTGRTAAAIAGAQGLLERHPFRERSWRHLMLALYREGRQAEALAAFRRARTVLDEELGLPPGPELRALEAAILRHDPSLDAPSAPGSADFSISRALRATTYRLYRPAGEKSDMSWHGVPDISGGSGSSAIDGSGRGPGTSGNDGSSRAPGNSGNDRPDRGPATGGDGADEESRGPGRGPASGDGRFPGSSGHGGLGRGPAGSGDGADEGSGGPGRGAASSGDGRLPGSGGSVASGGSFERSGDGRNLQSAGSGQSPQNTRTAGNGRAHEHGEPLVGRRAEEARIRERVEQAGAGAGGVLLVAGEAGIGKSRLAERAAELAAEYGIAVAWSRCVEASATPAFWPWVQVLRALPPTGDGQRLLDVLAGRGETPWRSEDPDTALFHLHEAVAETLRAHAEARPVLVVVDDLHAADASSLQLLAHLAPALHRRPILVLGTLRPEAADADPALRETLALLANERGAERLRLDALTAEDIAVYAGRAAPVAQALLERTGGNPFYLKELLRLLEAEHPDGWGDAQAVTGTGVPESVRDVIGRRLSRLPEATRAMLETAAVIGRDVDLLLLEAATEDRTAGGHELVMAALEPAVAAGVLLEVPDGWDYRFSHALVRDAVYGGLSRLRRARLHRRVGEALEAYDRAEDPASLGRLVHHFTMAARLGVADRAVRYATRAAELAMAQLAYDEAARFLELALGALDPTGPGATGRRGRLLVQLGVARRAAGDVAGTRAVLDEALTLARGLGDDELAMDAATLFGGVTLWTWRPYLVADERMIGILRDQLARLDPADGARRAVLLGTLAVELYHHPDREQGLQYAAEAVRLARELGDPELRWRTLNNYWNVAWAPQHEAERRAVIGEMLAIEPLPRTVEVTARLHRMMLEAGDGDVAGFDADLARCVRLAEDIRTPVLPAQVGYARAGRAVLAGDWSAAERLADEAFALQEHTSLWGTHWIRLVLLYTSRRFQGRPGELVEELVRRADEPLLELLRPTAVLAACESGQEDRARALVERWGTARERLWCWEFVAMQWALVAARLGTPDPRELYAEMLPYAERFCTLGSSCATWGTLDFALAALAERLGEPAAALEHARRALAAHRRLGAAHLVAASEAQVAALAVAKS
ncbi:BTAD domain-containing putative transcriptional regulator [Dactylosporangium sp. CA-139066]|uniref:BTAD domain-containing putative transcriptional regulator n=1 Tax=Dactylosporangium sp. CA-139066 TaxID=3239930 RepID=UPI003D8DAF51